MQTAKTSNKTSKSSSSTRKKTTNTKKTTTSSKQGTKKTSSVSESGKNLVIVESPAKSNTIKKFLGKDYEVKASMGHVIDLPQKKFGVDIENNFAPTYEVSADKKKVINELKKLAKNYEKVWIATDEDREGEAIGYHIVNQLGLDKNKTPRIVFHEITKNAIQNALKNPRTIDENLVNSQQSRRILDRIVGFKISPILWEKVKRGLSAGRVQSVAVKLIIEKEREIQNFVPEETWQVKTELSNGTQAYLEKINGKKIKLKTQADLDYVFKDIINQNNIREKTDEKTGNKILYTNDKLDFILNELKTSNSKKSPQPPFITSTLQQQASQRFGWGVKQVMRIAQKLYEGGYITYMRTDSISLSKQAISQSKSFIESNYGKQFSQSRNFKTKSGNAQEAHEAIRPTNISDSPDKINLTGQDKKLYTLIWIRTVASQMSDAKVLNTTYNFYPYKAQHQLWSAKGQVIQFEGFLNLYKNYFGSYSTKEVVLPEMKEGDIQKSKNISALQEFSKPPARYNEASLVKKLEQEGIGRPSTYAPTISTIIDRGYIRKGEDKKLYPNDIAFMVNDFLEKYFPNLMDYNFTANMETRLDEIAKGNYDWIKMLNDFYQKFSKELDSSSKGEVDKMYVGKTCPSCKKGNLIYKFGKMGKFIACDNYPDCKHTEQSEEEKEKMQYLREKYEGDPCPEGGTIVVKMGKYGPFLASSEYPKVKRISPIPDEKTEELEKEHGGINCDKCGQGTMHVKKSKRGYFLACNKYPECKNIKNIKK